MEPVIVNKISEFLNTDLLVAIFVQVLKKQMQPSALD